MAGGGGGSYRLGEEREVGSTLLFGVVVGRPTIPYALCTRFGCAESYVEGIVIIDVIVGRLHVPFVPCPRLHC